MTLSRRTSVAFFFPPPLFIVKPTKPPSDINWMRNTQAASESTVGEAALTLLWTIIVTFFRGGNEFKLDGCFSFSLFERSSSLVKVMIYN